jgi:hypothetical protein
MSLRTFDVVLRKNEEGRWTTDAMQLPDARVQAVLDGKGASVPFQVADRGIALDKRSSTTFLARIELPSELVTSAALEQAKLDVERDKVVSAERSGRRTVYVSVITAVVSAAATIAVAAITNGVGKPDKPQVSNVRDISECREGLINLKTLAALEQQTLPDLRTAVRHQVDDCTDRLKSALAAAPQ